MIPFENFYEVALSRPLRREFTYGYVNESKTSRLEPGTIVKVPFGRGELQGVITREVAVPQGELLNRIKPIASVIFETPIFSKILLDLTRWVSDYYLCSWGEALANALPPLTKNVPEITPSSSSFLAEPHFSKDLTVDQKDAIEFIHKRQSENKPFLIHGVTGSGKTEIYLRLAGEALRSGRSVIYLVPEIALMDQIRLFTEEVFLDQVVLFHSKQTPKERRNAWFSLKRGEKKFVLGPRSALFAPLENVGLIIVDEEHDDSYKQEETPRYHARLTAWKRAKLERATLVLGSATPSLEVLEAVKEGKCHAIRLENRISDAKPSQIRLVDLKREKREGLSSVSATLSEGIRSRIEKKEGVLLFLNRRGFSTQVKCRECGYFCMCSHCDVALTFHQEMNRLICHYCGYGLKPPDKCPTCGAYLTFSGSGTEKIENEIAHHFPEAKIDRLDRDTVSRKGNLEEAFERFRKGTTDILVGTQMLTKGLDFKNLTLVGVLLADSSLQLPDFRAAERTYQLLEQVAGRSGRGEAQGEVVIQTYLPTHYAIQAVLQRDSEKYIEKELEHRAKWHYPPFYQLINLTVRGRQENVVIKEIEKLKALVQPMTLDPLKQLEVMGPAPLPFYRLRGYFRWHLMIKGRDLSEFKQELSRILESYKASSGLYLEVDVDPVHIL